MELAYLDVTGIDTDDVYMVAYTLIRTTQNNEDNQLRVLKSSSQDSTGNYDQAHKHFSTTTSYSDGYKLMQVNFKYTIIQMMIMVVVKV